MLGALDEPGDMLEAGGVEAGGAEVDAGGGAEVSAG